MDPKTDEVKTNGEVAPGGEKDPKTAQPMNLLDTMKAIEEGGDLDFVDADRPVEDALEAEKPADEVKADAPEGETKADEDKKDETPEPTQLERDFAVLKAENELNAAEQKRLNYKLNLQSTELGNLRKTLREEPLKRRAPSRDEEVEEEIEGDDPDDRPARGKRRELDEEIRLSREARGELVRTNVESAVHDEMLLIDQQDPTAADVYKKELTATFPKYKEDFDQALQARTPKQAREFVRLATKAWLADAKHLRTVEEAKAAKARTGDQAAALVKAKKAATPASSEKVTSSIAESRQDKKPVSRWGDPDEIAAQLRKQGQPGW